MHEMMKNGRGGKKGREKQKALPSPAFCSQFLT
jgi:hypothetical protein